MSRMVKCLYCGKSFCPDLEPFVKPNSTRYAHKACYEKAMADKAQEEKDKILLERYIKELFKYDTIPVRIIKQLKDYTSINKYTYSGILGSLKYFFEVKHNSIERANGGIGIVPYIYDEARRYYLNLAIARDRNREIIKNQKQEIQQMPTKEVIIAPPQRQSLKHEKRLFTFLERDDDNEQ